MSLHIPQTALHSLACDCCHKYLSVTPVKVFPNRKIKCGRCISNEDNGGITSMYNEVAIKSIFNCINHYEGCKALLHTSEVLEHEQTCKTAKYECPNCNEEIPSYFMYKHFTNKHKELVLENPYFVVNESEESERLAHFLYCYKDYMIFLKYSSDEDPYSNYTNALFKFSLLNSKTDETLKVNVLITSGKIVKENKMDCDIFPLDAGNDFKVKLDLKENMLVVAFSLEEPNPNVGIPKAMNKEPSDLNVKLLHLYFRENETVELLDPSKKKIKEIKLSDMVFNCFKCSLAFRTEESHYNVVYKCGRYYLICFMCKRAQNWSQKYKVHSRYVEATSYLCKWECGTRVDYNDLLEHEESCKNQSSQPCPVELCDHNCKLFEIKEHFKNKHTNLKSPYNSESIGTDLYLKSSFSPLKKIEIVSHVYIAIELIWNKLEWEISLTCKIPNARPRMIILDDALKFVTLIKGKGSCPCLNKSIIYKCYLADPRKELYE